MYIVKFGILFAYDGYTLFYYANQQQSSSLWIERNLQVHVSWLLKDGNLSVRDKTTEFTSSPKGL